MFFAVAIYGCIIELYYASKYFLAEELNLSWAAIKKYNIDTTNDKWSLNAKWK